MSPWAVFLACLLGGAVVLILLMCWLVECILRAIREAIARGLGW